MFVIFSLTQMLVGIVALMSHAVGRKDQPDANLIFNQSLVLSGLCALVTIVAGYGCTKWYMGALGADEAPVVATPAPAIFIGSCRGWRCSLRWSRWARRCAAQAS